MQKTLGGDRLGSGKKMKVQMHGYERSTHDLGYLWRSTMSAGTLVPFLKKLVLPGDTFDIDLNCDIKTHPTIGPLFGSYKVQLDVFQAPIRLYNSYLHNNKINIGRKMSDVKFPLIELTAIGAEYDGVNDIDNSQINPSCLLSYLGIRGVGKVNSVDGNQIREFNAIPILAYWEIVKNYYANKQEEIGAVIHTPRVALVDTVDTIELDEGTGAEVLAEDPATSNIQMTAATLIRILYTGATPILSQIIVTVNPGGNISADQLSANWIDTGTSWEGYFDQPRWGDLTAVRWRMVDSTDTYNGAPIVADFPLQNIDLMRELILSSPGNVPVVIADLAQPPYTWLSEVIDGSPNTLSTQEGLAIKTYQSDLFNNWLSTEWIDGVGGISEITAVDTSGGSFTIDAITLARKVYDMLNRIAVSGGTYDDWLDVNWDHDRYQRCETPMYMGGLIKELVFQEVVSNSAAQPEEGAQPLGTLAGKGVLAKKHKGGSIVVRVDEPSYIIGLISLTPRIDYSQGNDFDVHLKTMDDPHKPALDQIGFQELITEQLSWWDTEWDPTPGEWVQKSAGKQPAWINYMTSVNKVYGNFAVRDNEMFMTLNRRYEYESGIGIKDLTTYIDPVKFNQIFANTALDAQNFWAQISVDITARRKMSAKIMPNL